MGHFLNTFFSLLTLLVIFWLKMLNSYNLALHALANCCKDSIISTLEKCGDDRQLNLVSASEYLIKEYFWNHFSCFYENVVLILLFYFCLLLSFVVYCMRAFCVLVLFCCFGEC